MQSPLFLKGIPFGGEQQGLVTQAILPETLEMLTYKQHISTQSMCSTVLNLHTRPMYHFENSVCALLALHTCKNNVSATHTAMSTHEQQVR